MNKGLIALAFLLQLVVCAAGKPNIIFFLAHYPKASGKKDPSEK